MGLPPSGFTMGNSALTKSKMFFTVSAITPLSMVISHQAFYSKCSGLAADEVVHADVEGVSLPRPGSTQSTGSGVHLEHGRLVAVHEGITAG